jgi:hypothetical protein
MGTKDQLLNQLKEDKQLINSGEGDSSSGSDDAPSDDNFCPTVMSYILPNDNKKKGRIKIIFLI